MNPGSRRTARRAPASKIPSFRRLPIGSLRVFVCVAEALSFTRAAELLGVTVSAASMQIRALEQHLGLPLFRRDGRNVQLTAEGVQLLPRVREGLNLLQSAIDDTRAVRGAGALRISTLHSWLLQWLLPRLPDFEARHPKVALLVETSNVPVDFNRSNVQAAVRFGRGNYPGLYVEKVLDEWLVPVCSPALFKQLGAVETQDDLQRYRLLHSSTEPWSSWLDGSYSDSWPDEGYAFDDSTAVVRSAEAGAGLALARWSLVGAELASGRLCMASSKATPYALAYYFVCPMRSRTVAKLVSFREWLQQQAALQPVPAVR